MRISINMGKKHKILVIVGPTASGKSDLGVQIALEQDGEVISADSRQVYRRMDLGTGKDYEDYLVGGTRIPVHGIDILEPGEEYNVYAFQQDFIRIFREMEERGALPVLCGGSG